ncbi:hypothetical protein AAVH_34456 [Aphelenchoides avenae]|nr:hypothetical protein AAVH_34456 [Aphelenchus avenae]
MFLNTVNQHMTGVCLRWINSIWAMRTSSGYMFVLEGNGRDVREYRHCRKDLEEVLLRVIRNAHVGRLTISKVAEHTAVKRLIFQYGDFEISACAIRKLVTGFNSISSLVVFESNMAEDYQTDDLLNACQMKGLSRVAFVGVTAAYSSSFLSDISDDGIIEFLCGKRASLRGKPRELCLQHPAVSPQLVAQIVESLRLSDAQDILLEIVPASEPDFDLDQLQHYRREEQVDAACLQCKRTIAVYEIPGPVCTHIRFTGKLLSLRCGKTPRKHCCDLNYLLSGL